MLQENAVRLFDKGEMNTFSDPVSFIHRVASHLKELLFSSLDTTDIDTDTDTDTRQCHIGAAMSHCGTSACSTVEQYTFDESRHEEWLSLLVHECNVLLDSLTSRLDKVDRTSPPCPFMEAGQYRDDAVSLYRSLVALRCLSRFTHHSHQVAHLSCTLAAWFTQTGGALNTLLAQSLTQT